MIQEHQNLTTHTPKTYFVKKSDPKNNIKGVIVMESLFGKTTGMPITASVNREQIMNMAKCLGELHAAAYFIYHKKVDAGDFENSDFLMENLANKIQPRYIPRLPKYPGKNFYMILIVILWLILEK